MGIKTLVNRLRGKPQVQISAPTNFRKAKVSSQLGRYGMYLFCPFSGYTDDVVDKQIWKYANKINAQVLQPTRDFETFAFLNHVPPDAEIPHALAEVEPTSTLLIAGHGDFTANSISAKFGASGTWKDITAQDLANLLFLEGLSQEHIKIRLLSCWGGGLNPNDNDNARNAAAAETFAAVLAKALGALSYRNVRVAGYRGMTGWYSNQTVHTVVYLGNENS